MTVCLFVVVVFFLITALLVFGGVNSTLDKRSFRTCIDDIVKSFPDEDGFESLIDFLTKSVEVRRAILCCAFFFSFLC